MIALAETRERDTLDRQVVSFAATGGEYDALGLAAEQYGDFGPPTLDRRLGDGATPVCARRVAEPVLKVRAHRVERLGRDRRGGVVIEVDHRRSARGLGRADGRAHGAELRRLAARVLVGGAGVGVDEFALDDLCVGPLDEQARVLSEEQRAGGSGRPEVDSLARVLGDLVVDDDIGQL